MLEGDVVASSLHLIAADYREQNVRRDDKIIFGVPEWRPKTHMKKRGKLHRKLESAKLRKTSAWLDGCHLEKPLLTSHSYIWETTSRIMARKTALNLENGSRVPNIFVKDDITHTLAQ